MAIILSPNMNLPVPVVGQEPGPQYASDINACMSLLDAHNHTPGSGVSITPNAIDINADLPINGNNLTSIRAARFSAQGTPIPASPPDLNEVYVAGVDLYYNDGNGNIIRMTQSGSVAGASGSISGLVSPASATYVPGSSTFVWQSDANIAANMDNGSVIIRKLTVSSPGITISAPVALASDYTINLPAAPPAANSFMTIDNSGNITATIPTSHGISVANQVLKSTGTTVGLDGIAVAPSSGVFVFSSASPLLVTNQDVTITTSGRPVRIELMGDGAGGNTYIGGSATANTEINVTFYWYRDGVEIDRSSIVGNASATNGTLRIPPSSLSFTDVVPAGTYQYQLFASKTTGTNVIGENVVMKVYET